MSETAALKPFARYAKALAIAEAPVTAAVRYDPLCAAAGLEPSAGDVLRAADLLMPKPEEGKSG